MTTTTGTCWADPLTRAERCRMRLKLARAANRFHLAHEFTASAEMADLHLDVTERAEVPQR